MQDILWAYQLHSARLMSRYKGQQCHLESHTNQASAQPSWWCCKPSVARMCTPSWIHATSFSPWLFYPDLTSPHNWAGGSSDKGNAHLPLFKRGRTDICGLHRAWINGKTLWYLWEVLLKPKLQRFLYIGCPFFVENRHNKSQRRIASRKSGSHSLVEIAWWRRWKMCTGPTIRAQALAIRPLLNSMPQSLYERSTGKRSRNSLFSSTRPTSCTSPVALFLNPH